MALMAPETTPLVLTVRRGEMQMVVPAKPTPHEEKPLSDIDDQEGLRFHIPGIMFYRADPSMEGEDPVKVVKEGLAKALVFYYPFAGRLKEGQNRKLVVDCTAEGVPFFEAEADAMVEDFGGDEIHPPFPLEDLLCEIPGTDAMIDTPILIVQVTRLKCGGFIVAHRVNHAITDGTGIMQLMNAVGDMARGCAAPALLPVWERHRLNARDSPCVTFPHREYEQHHHANENSNGHSPAQIQQSFFFRATDLAALRTHAPSSVKPFSTFDILSASLWRCRTIAMEHGPNDEVGFFFAVNALGKFNPPLPSGYYGNACAFPVVRARAGDITSKPLGFILELIRKAKEGVSEEYMKSVADLMVTRDRPHFSMHLNYVVSDLRHIGFSNADFGWGKPVFGGPASVSIPHVSFFIAFKNKKGENMTMVPISLPPHAMDIFVSELQGMLKTKP